MSKGHEGIRSDDIKKCNDLAAELSFMQFIAINSLALVMTATAHPELVAQDKEVEEPQECKSFANSIDQFIAFHIKESAAWGLSC